jgi:hypothetical protein
VSYEENEGKTSDLSKTRAYFPIYCINPEGPELNIKLKQLLCFQNLDTISFHKWLNPGPGLYNFLLL